MSLVNLKQWVEGTLSIDYVTLQNDEGATYKDSPLTYIEIYPFMGKLDVTLEDADVSFYWHKQSLEKEQVFEAILEGLSIYQEKLEGYLDEVIEYLEHQDTEG